MIINVDETGLGTTKNITQERLTVPEIFIDEFHNSITIENTKNLYKKFKTIEIKGYITHDKFIESMKEIFDEIIRNKIIKLYNENKILKMNFSINQNIDEYIHEIYELYFLRFREIKCIIKNNKTVFYLTDFIPENHINTYNIICSLVVLMKSPFNVKIKLLFELTDIDEDGFLNEAEIRHMITTSNFLFCDERNAINMNSSILSQSLMNFRVNEILKQILYEPGNLYRELEEEKYINFDSFCNSIIKVKNYKYDILPSFINLKFCLKNKKIEKIIKVDNKYRNDFINISSGLFNHKSFCAQRNLFHKSSSTPNLGSIIRPKKLNDDINKYDTGNNRYELPNISKTFYNNKKKSLLGSMSNTNSSNNNFNINVNNASKSSLTKSQKTSGSFHKSLYNNKYPSSRNEKNRNKLFIEKRKTFKDLLRESTILENNEEKTKTNDELKNFNKSSYFNRAKEAKYIFEAYLDKIRNMEVKPGIIQFIQPNQDIEKDNSSGSGTNRNMNIINNNATNINICNVHKSSDASKRKISNEKNNNEAATKVFRLSSKSILDENIKNDYQNYVIKEEVSDEEKDNEKKNNKLKKTLKIKKYKIITQSKSNKEITNSNKSNKQIANIIKRDNKKNLTISKYIPKTESVGRIRNYSFNRKRPSIFLRKKISIINTKNAFKLQKNIMSINLKSCNVKYKTLDEVFNEINIQETKFNSDYGGYNEGMRLISNKIHEEQNDLKRFLNEGERKEGETSIVKDYFKRLRNLTNKKDENNKEIKEISKY